MKKMVLTLLTFISLGGYAQQVKLVEGNLKLMRGEKVLRTEFIYDGMLISKKDLSEVDYIKRKKDE